jgi:hypothetical protein
MYETINDAMIRLNETSGADHGLKIVSASYKYLELSVPINRITGSEFQIRVTPQLQGGAFKLERKEYEHNWETANASQRESLKDSITLYGVKEFELRAGELLVWDGATRGRKIIEMAEKIVGKYKNGIHYVDTVWKGDCRLDLDMTFRGASKYDAKENGELNYINYKCFSNEFMLTKGLRVRTTGRQ